MARVDSWGPYWLSGSMPSGGYASYVIGPDPRIDEAAFYVSASPHVQQIGPQHQVATISVSLGARSPTYGTTHRNLYATFQNVGPGHVSWLKIYVGRIAN